MTYNQFTTVEFIKRAKAIHGNTYDYSDVRYINLHMKVKIKCKKHGVFEQMAGNHINPRIKAGCPYCSGKALFYGENDLASQFPDIAKYFDEELKGCFLIYRI